MEFKVLVTILVPEIERNFEVYLPVNKTIGEVLKLINKLINESTSGIYPMKNNLALCNRFTNEIYPFNKFVRDTDIRNGTQLVFY
jgi:hypothetical protein